MLLLLVNRGKKIGSKKRLITKVGYKNDDKGFELSNEVKVETKARIKNSNSQLN